MNGSPTPTTPRAPAARRFDPWIIGGGLALLLALFVMVRSDLSQVDWVARLSHEGSAPPTRDNASPTGYALGQRQFLGTHERGDTYRWIATTQEALASGRRPSPTYQADNVPVGRPRLTPNLYAGWLVVVSWGVHAVTGETLALSAEQSALWEPVVSHVIVFAAVVVLMGLWFGFRGAIAGGLFFALYPPAFGQFLPGVLSTRPWAILLAAYAVASSLPRGKIPGATNGFSLAAAITAGLALWLDPAFGFAAVLLCAAAGAAAIPSSTQRFPCVRWSMIGAGLTVLAWVVDQSPWDPSAGELRYVHPLYGLAWVGLGLGLDGWQRLRLGTGRRRILLGELGVAGLLGVPLVYVQLKHDYWGWLYSSAGMRRLTSLDESAAHDTMFAWLGHASIGEVAFVAAPLAGAAIVWAVAAAQRQRGQPAPRVTLVVTGVVLAGMLVMSSFRLRWSIVASLVALPLLWQLAAFLSVAWRRALAAAAVVLLVGLAAWDTKLPPSFRRPSAGTPPGAANIEALVFRHLAHWLATHNPGQKVNALAPPEVSDSLVFHGGSQVVMSTAWESYSGQVAASRVLSAPESTEAEAVLQSREVTHVILPSWDRVLPLLVQKPTDGRDTLYDRLQRWVLPRYLRSLPYRLPPAPGYLDQKVAVFKITPPQDEALSLSRLAEYFVEMNRSEPAALAAKVLAESFPDDPSAVIARASVYAQTKDAAAFERELARLVADVSAERSAFSWDRRVQRAIVLALGRRWDLARTEIAACVSAATRDGIFDLTPLQAYRLHTLATQFDLTFPDPAIAPLLTSLGAEYSPATESRR